MTDIEANIAVAIACGWKRVHAPGLPGLVVGKAPVGYCGDKTHYEIEPRGDWWEVPDYGRDLNAMHEAEGIFPHSSGWYQHNLALVCGGANRIYHATAAQRREAFLRALNLWKD